MRHAAGNRGRHEHGYRRTNEDKRRAVETLLRDSEWSTWSAAEIARKCAVSFDFAARMKREHAPSLSSDESDQSRRTYTDRHGNATTMDTSRIGRGQQQAPPARASGAGGSNRRETLRNSPHHTRGATQRRWL
mgnify:CR=1 FL=1